MLRHDLKQSFHARKPSNVAELKLLCREEWAKITPQHVKDSCPVITNAWLQSLLLRVALPVIRFRGQLLFHVVPGGFGQLFSLNHYLKTASCIYSGYLCIILKFVWWSETLNVTNMPKKQEGPRNFSWHFIYIYERINYIIILWFWINHNIKNFNIKKLMKIG